MFYERYPAAVLEHQIQVRPFNVEKTRNMRSLNPEGMQFTVLGIKNVVFSLQISIS